MDINVQWFLNYLIKKTFGGTVKNQIMSNKELAEELHKASIRKFEKKKVLSPDTQQISKFNKQFRFLL